MPSRPNAQRTPTRVTIHTVAAQAGVSTATVSKVINQIKAGVSETTRERVEAAIAATGYRPNRIGRNLRRQHHGAVGMAIIDPSPRFLADPFTANLVSGLGNRLNAQGLGLLLYGVAPGELGKSSLIRNSEVDAICLNPAGSLPQRLEAITAARSTGLPVLVVQDHPRDDDADSCYVRQDDFAGALLLADEILARRPKRVLMMITHLPWPAVEKRRAGMEDAFARANVTFSVAVCDETDPQAICQAIDAELTANGVPDVIIGQNDQVAIAALQVLAQRKLRVPEDVGVTGFNALPFTGLAVPSLTSIRSAAYEIGERAAYALIERLNKGAFAQREYLLPLSPHRGESL